MADLIHMEIAGVQFIIRCRDSVILEQFPPIYKPFLRRTDSEEPGSAAVHIRLELQDIPDTGKMRKIFDTNESWSMYKDGNDYVMALNPPVLDGQAVWLARFNEDFSETILYCGGSLLRETADGQRVLNPVVYPLDQLLLIHILTHRQGALIHAAGFELDGKGYIFPGHSGAGKSTLMASVVRRRGSGLLSDDRVAVRKIDSRFMAYGTPWAGDAGIAENRNAPLAGMFFIAHANLNRIEEMKPKRAMERLMSVTSIPWYDEGMLTKSLSFCESLVSKVPAYTLFFKPDTEVVDFLEGFVAG